MMNFLKKNIKLIIGIIIGVALTSGSIFAYSYFANNIGYTKQGSEDEINVETALNDLYSKLPKDTIQITTKGSQIDVGSYKYADTTGMYTASEYNSKTGEGTNWKYSTDYSWRTNSSDSTKKDLILNIGFKPTRLYFEGKENNSSGVLDKHVIYYIYLLSNGNYKLEGYYRKLGANNDMGRLENYDSSNDKIVYSDGKIITVGWGSAFFNTQFSFIAIK